MSWWIAAWSRERGVGEVASGIGRLPFDAAIALVDDFEIGELVHVRLEPAGDTWKVLSVAPDLPRFRPPATAEGTAPLDDGSVRACNEVIDACGQGDHSYFWRSQEAEATFEIRDRSDAYSATTRLVLSGVTYVEMSVEEGIDCRVFRLATDEERAYLATRTSIGARSIALTFLDYDGRFYFVVCRALAMGET